MEFDLKEVIKISEYVRVGSQSSPTTKTKVFIDEYLEVKNIERIDNAMDWWKHLSEKEKWNLTVNYLSHWVDLEKEQILKLWVSSGYGA
jgi:hypothetical protein|tara:strand:+ start:1417 stop:1683 length:267 start_codon:yes stop_codon:yes gene_type:complete